MYCVVMVHDSIQSSTLFHKVSVILDGKLEIFWNKMEMSGWYFGINWKYCVELKQNDEIYGGGTCTLTLS